LLFVDRLAAVELGEPGSHVAPTPQRATHVAGDGSRPAARASGAADQRRDRLSAPPRTVGDIAGGHQFIRLYSENLKACRRNVVERREHRL